MSILLSFISILYAGELDPPGPPSSGGTMKTLDEVEPRAAVNAENTPGDTIYTYVISQSGSYYLTDNIVITDFKGGIKIDVNDVTLDLCDFTIKSDYTGTNYYDGIYISVNHSNVTVKNGTVRDFRYGAVSSGVNNTGIKFQGIRSIDNRETGISVYGTTNTYYNGGGAVIKNCLSMNNEAEGIYAASGSIVADCVVKSNGGKGIFANSNSVVRNCVVYSNADIGIDVNIGSVVENNVSGRNLVGIKAIGSMVRGNNVHANQQHGIDGGNCLVDQNTALFNNAGDGSYVNINATSGTTVGTNHAP